MYIVTGGAGMIGSVMVGKLNEEGIADILIVDELQSSEKWLNLRNKHYADYVNKNDFLDLLETGELAEMSEDGISGIIHMGASSSTTESNMDYLMENNVNYSKSLFAFAAQNDIPFIYASSAATYGAGELGFDDDDDEKTLMLQPTNRYGYSKQLFDKWLIENELMGNAVGLKFFNVYGPNEYHKGGQASVSFHAHRQFKEEGSIKLFKSNDPTYADGEQVRDHVYVKDCAEVMWWLLQNPEVRGLFNVGTGTARTWNDLAKSISSALGAKESISYIEMPEKLRSHYQNFTEAKMQKLQNAGCNVNMRPLEEGVADYVQNYLEQGCAVY